MNLVEQINVRQTNPLYKELDEICFLSKNVYNTALYNWRQEYIINKKSLSLSKNYHLIKQTDVYKMLPHDVFTQQLKLVYKNIKSYFEALKEYNKNPKKFLGKPKLPKYKDSEKGRCATIFPIKAIRKGDFKKLSLISLTRTNIKFKSYKVNDLKNLKQVRIIPKNKKFVIEVVYEQKEKEMFLNDNYASIDLGVNNLAAVTFNDGQNPFIINGRPLKSMNQYFNKEKAKIQSTLERRNKNKWSNTLSKLNEKRNNKIKDYLHKSSRIIVNQLVSKNTSTLIIGRNKNWKQDIKMRKDNKQNFVNIPFYMFINMLKYKCELEGISVIEQEEAYTSKCSFLDNEEIKKQEKYKGRRTKRGLFKTSTKRFINADLNGSYNIMKKAIRKNFLKEMDRIEGVMIHPRLISV